jgi:hypothetical protein
MSKELGTTGEYCQGTWVKREVKRERDNNNIDVSVHCQNGG